METPVGTIDQAQADLRQAYLGGGPGTVVSGSVWLAAGLVAQVSGVKAGFLVLYFGGLLIFPLSLLVVRCLYRRPALPPGNLGAHIVGETVIPMIGGLLGAWLLLPFRPELVFPIAAIAVGGHYFGFRSAYGDRTFWLLGAILCGIGLAPIFLFRGPAPIVAFTVSGAEALFGAWLTLRTRSDLER